jgi:hypothetical protein
MQSGVGADPVWWHGIPSVAAFIGVCVARGKQQSRAQATGAQALLRASKASGDASSEIVIRMAYARRTE